MREGEREGGRDGGRWGVEEESELDWDRRGFGDEKKWGRRERDSKESGSAKLQGGSGAEERREEGRREERRMGGREERRRRHKKTQRSHFETKFFRKKNYSVSFFTPFLSLCFSETACSSQQDLW